jgi:hypothetical protein
MLPLKCILFVIGCNALNVIILLLSSIYLLGKVCSYIIQTEYSRLFSDLATRIQTSKLYIKGSTTGEQGKAGAGVHACVHLPLESVPLEFYHYLELYTFPTLQ